MEIRKLPVRFFAQYPIICREYLFQIKKTARWALAATPAEKPHQGANARFLAAENQALDALFIATRFF